MNSVIVSALISGSFSIAGIFLSFFTNLKAQQKNEKKPSSYKMWTWRAHPEVWAHNNFASRIPVLEAKIEILERKEEQKNG